MCDPTFVIASVDLVNSSFPKKLDPKGGEKGIWKDPFGREEIVKLHGMRDWEIYIDFSYTSKINHFKNFLEHLVLSKLEHIFWTALQTTITSDFHMVVGDRSPSWHENTPFTVWPASPKLGHHWCPRNPQYTGGSKFPGIFAKKLQ